MIIINPYYVSERTGQLTEVALALDTVLKAHPEIEEVTGAMIINYVPIAAQYSPYTDGEIYYIADKIGATIKEI